MPDEANTEHVVALAFQPIRGPVDVVDAGDLQRLTLGKLRLHAQKPAERQRSQMPDDFDRNLGVAILDGGHVAQKIVALRLIVVQPANDVVNQWWMDEHHRLAPDDFDALDRRAELVLQRLRRWIRFATAMGDAFLGRWRAGGRTLARPHDIESTHDPDLV